MGGKLGDLAREIAEETAGNFTDDMENATDANEVFQKLFKNPGKLMGLVKNVGEKLDSRIKSGDINESELLSEATELMGKMSSSQAKKAPAQAIKAAPAAKAKKAAVKKAVIHAKPAAKPAPKTAAKKVVKKAAPKKATPKKVSAAKKPAKKKASPKKKG